MTTAIPLYRFDFKRLWRNIWLLVRSKTMAETTLTFLIILSIFTGLYYENHSVRIGIIISACIFLISMGIFVLVVKIKNVLDPDNASYGNPFSYMEVRSIWILWAPAVMFLLGSCFHFGDPYKKWIIDERPMTTSVLAVPFWNDIRGVSINQSVSFEATATTKDGILITAKVTAALALDDNPIYWTSDGQLEEMAKLELSRRFQAAIGEMTSDDLKNGLMMEWKVGNQAGMSPTGVKWNGSLAITDLHVRLQE